MVFRNLLLGSIFLAATAFAQKADSTTKDAQLVPFQITTTQNTNKPDVAVLGKQKKVIKPETSWTKIKDLFN